MMKLHQGEHKLLIIRKHRILLWFEAALFGIFIITPLIVAFILRGALDLTLSANMLPFLWMLFFAWAMAMWIGFFIFATDYTLDTWVATNQRIIDIEQKGLFSREISSIHYENIQDVTATVKGFWATMLGFGELRIQSAGTKHEFVMRFVLSPNQAKRDIMTLYNDTKLKNR